MSGSASRGATAVALTALGMALAGCSNDSVAEPRPSVDSKLAQDTRDRELREQAEFQSRTAEAAVQNARPVDPSVDVTFELSGTATAVLHVTYGTDSGIQQDASMKVPWRKTVEFDDADSPWINMNAQNKGVGELTCTIYIDGVEVATSTSTGEFAVVHCMPR